MQAIKEFSDHFIPKSGAVPFFSSILVWGIGAGCFTAVLNNYLAEVRGVDEFQRGLLEFFREMPGLLLVFILALMHKKAEWKILRIGTLISLAGVAGLLLSADKAVITLLIMIWSTGEHILMPVRSTIAMHVAKAGRIGESLGVVTGAMNAGNVIGSATVAAIFFAGIGWFGIADKVVLYNIVWVLICLLLFASFLCTLFCKIDVKDVKRPRLYYNRKYGKFYVLELFYGARKQIFITFAPYVLILNYGMDTTTMALLVGVCALVNIFCAPLIGKLTDRIGYRNIMIFDTVILFFVCITYGYANRMFTYSIAYAVVCMNFLLDAVISTTAMATSMYVRDISDSAEEVTATLTTGISINHLISILAALAGGWVWQKFGVGVLFSFSAVMALANSAFAMLIPRKQET